MQALGGGSDASSSRVPATASRDRDCLPAPGSVPSLAWAVSGTGERASEWVCSPSLPRHPLSSAPPAPFSLPFKYMSCKISQDLELNNLINQLDGTANCKTIRPVTTRSLLRYTQNTRQNGHVQGQPLMELQSLK